MLKIFSLVIIVVALLVLTPLGGEFKDRVISKVNPAITERKIVADLQENLDTLSETINNPKFQKMSAAEQLTQLNGLVRAASTLAESAQETATKSDFLAGVSTLVNKIIPDKTASQSSDNTCLPK